jgi:hypothetical protein
MEKAEQAIPYIFEGVKKKKPLRRKRKSDL